MNLGAASPYKHYQESSTELLLIRLLCPCSSSSRDSLRGLGGVIPIGNCPKFTSLAFLNNVLLHCIGKRIKLVNRGTAQKTWDHLQPYPNPHGNRKASHIQCRVGTAYGTTRSKENLRPFCPMAPPSSPNSARALICQEQEGPLN